MPKQEDDKGCFTEGEIAGFYTHELSKRMKSYLQNLAAQDGDNPVAVSNGWLIGYLYENRDQEIYQRDLENKLHLAKSSITSMLQNLEQAGFVRRETPAHDARQKKVVLTDAGCEFEQRMRRRITATERQIRRDIPEEDMQVFYRVIRRMIENIS